MTKQVSLKDIAERVGVSSATVSLVLNGKEKGGRVGVEMSGKIRNVAKELNYKPNNLARSLRMGRSQAIGLIVADITNPFFADLSFQIQEYAEKLNYTVIITNINESVEKMNRMIDILKTYRVEGLLIIPPQFGEHLLKKLDDNKVPLVLIDRHFADNQPVFEMGKRAVDLLIKQIEKGANNKIPAKVELLADISDK